MTEIWPNDRYGIPIVVNQKYRLTPPGRPSILVLVYSNEDETLMIENLNKKVGESNRFQPVYDVHRFAEWVQVDADGVDIEPDRSGKDHRGFVGLNKIDQLAEIESRSLMLRHELQRLEHLAKQALGGPRYVGPRVAEAIFEMVFNKGSAESVMEEFYRQPFVTREKTRGTR